MKRRVVVTGLSAITPLGLDVETTWENAVAGKSGIQRIDVFDIEEYSSQIAGMIKGFDPANYIEKKDIKKVDPFIQYAIACAKQLIDDSGLKIEDHDRERMGVYIGCGIGGLPGIEKQKEILTDRGPSRVSPFFIPSVISNMASGHVSIITGAKGPNLTMVSACASGAHAIGEAAHVVSRGDCDIMITGGTEATICPLALSGFGSMKALSTRNSNPEMASRPFDKDRDGFVIAEGASLLMLEEYEHAKKRGAKIYAELAGYGLSSDAFHMTNPAENGEGAALAMRVALKNAEINPERINYINAHGTSTGAGDIAETKAIKSVFGSHTQNLWISSTKSMTGHLLGAAGSLEATLSIKALITGIAPPTINLEYPDPQCDLDYVPISAREGNFNYVMSNSFGFGGTNATLIFSKL